MRHPPPLPPGLRHLLKSVYGLKLESTSILCKVLEMLRFTRSEFDHILFILDKMDLGPLKTSFFVLRYHDLSSALTAVSQL
jgi:hypothetical protein